MLIFSLFSARVKCSMIAVLLFPESVFLALLIRFKMFILANFQISFSLLMLYLDVLQCKTSSLYFTLSMND